MKVVKRMSSLEELEGREDVDGVKKKVVYHNLLLSTDTFFFLPLGNSVWSLSNEILLSNNSGGNYLLIYFEPFFVETLLFRIGPIY